MTRPFRLLAPFAVLAACLVAGATVPATAAATTASTTTVRAPSTTTVGAPTTLVAAVRPATATGTVRFAAAGAVLSGCGSVALVDGRATCRTTFTSTRAVSVVARYGGGGDVAPSQGSTSVRPADGAPGQVVGGTGTCTRAAGALVAVSFGAWGGPIVRGCDPSPTTGIDLLTTAGFTTTGTAHDGPQFVCRIAHPYWRSGTAYPTPADDPCVSTPPADAYWSYWIAPRGQNTWSYSTVGAYTDQPKPGTAEAWTFGSTDIGGTTGRPTFTPNQVRAGVPAA